MKRNQLYIAWTFVLASMMACTDNTPAIHPLDEEASRIYLSAGIGEAVSSRTPYSGGQNGNKYEVPTTSHPLDVSVWASTTSGVFPDSDLNGKTGTVAIHTQAHFQSGAPQLLGEAIYPTDPTAPEGEVGDPPTVYFVGFHPKSEVESSWTPSNDNKVASFTFTGKEDVMFAPRIEGEYGTAYDQSPTFLFRHLLTCIRIEMIADKNQTDVEKRKDVSEAWGEIKSLTIRSKQNVTVSKLSEGTFNPSNVAFVGDTVVMKLYQTGTDDFFENMMIPHEKATEVAYVMCAPVVGVGVAQADGANEGEYVTVPEYTLHIKTSQRELDIPIDLKKKIGDAAPTYFEGSTMGHQFLVQLNFKMGNVISVSAAISLDANTDWFTHGTGSEDLEEEDFSETTNQESE